MITKAGRQGRERSWSVTAVQSVLGRIPRRIPGRGTESRRAANLNVRIRTGFRQGTYARPPLRSVRLARAQSARQVAAHLRSEPLPTGVHEYIFSAASVTGTLKLMAVLAHPDDESLGTGGSLAKYGSEGVETYVVTATRGERESDLFEGLRT